MGKKPCFGTVRLTDDEAGWLRFLNQQIPALCKRMPSSLRDASMLAVQKHFAGFRLSHMARFYVKFQAPAWTLLYWLHVEAMGREKPDETLQHAMRMQAMAMFLHMLDDHVTDGQVPIDNLLLQLRTEAWMTFDEERRALGVGIDGADVTSSELIDRYFSSVHAPPAPDDLGTYEELFRGQMATGVAAPVLLARRAGMDEDGVRDMHESFGVSWRMLDDLRDIETDAARGSRSAVYFALPMSRRHEWPPPRSRESFDTCLEREVMPLLTSRICDLLGHSARVARDLGLRIMAEQYEALRGPMQTRREK